MTSKTLLYFICLILCALVILIFYQPFDFSNSWQKVSIQFPSSLVSNDKKSLPNEPRRFVIFSSSIHSKLRSYIFYTPITAAAWQRIGYEVIVVFVGDFTNYNNSVLKSQLDLTVAFLKRLDVHIINFQCPESYAVKMSQLVRIFAGYLPDTIVNDRDYIITTDSDIIPMHEENYQLKKNTSGFIYNAFCCGSYERRGKKYQMYPMSHICLPKKLWRDLFLESMQREEILKKPNLASSDTLILSDKAPFSFDTVSIYTRQEFKVLYDKNMTKGDAGWYMDQVYSSMLINDYCEKYPNIIIDKRHKYVQRLDPGLPSQVWEPERLKMFGDAHLIHDEIFDTYRWSRFKKLLLFLFNPSLANDFDSYYKLFTLTLREKPVDQ